MDHTAHWSMCCNWQELMKLISLPDLKPCSPVLICLNKDRVGRGKTLMTVIRLN